MVAGLGQRGSAQECFPAVANIWPSRDVRGQHLEERNERSSHLPRHTAVEMEQIPEPNDALWTVVRECVCADSSSECVCEA